MRASQTHTFQQFNDEISEFYKYLKENKYTDREIRKIFAPISPDTRKIKLTATIICTTIFISILLYFATYIETISWHFSALGRIFLIRLLPFWNWTGLKNAKCLIEKPTSSTVDEEIRFNCYLCENINQIDVYNDISNDLLKKKYLDIDVPVIIKKSWPRSGAIENFVDNLLENYELSKSQPCALSTNIDNGLPTIKNLLEKTALFDSFFLHFQNCDFRAMKQFRGFTPRPSFLPPELSPVQYNWLMWSRNYNGSQFKAIGLVDKIGVVGQIFGGNLIRLVPRANCEFECPIIDIGLKEGETIIFTSLWNLEYKPEIGENIAVILEMH